MDERKPEHLKAVPPSLQQAVRRARVESAEQSEAVDDLRQAEIVRLELLAEAMRPILDQTPEDVELFDAGIVHGERPRLFIDMISFVDLGHDRRTYRFFQDTRQGRVLIAESANVDRVVAAMTNYIARRLVEREQALASDWRSRSTSDAAIKTAARAKKLAEGASAAKNGEAAPVPSDKREAAAGGFWVRAADIFSFLLMTLGSFALVGNLVPRGLGRVERMGSGVLGSQFRLAAFLTSDAGLQSDRRGLTLADLGAFEQQPTFPRADPPMRTRALDPYQVVAGALARICATPPRRRGRR